jgi:outer membrane receptor for ferrienterochelin and colicins
MRVSGVVQLVLGLALAAPPTVLFEEGTTFADGVADEAELHFQIGATAYGKGDYQTALEHFLLSNRLVPNRNVGFNIALAFEKLGRFADAHRYYTDALLGETDPKILQSVNAAIARIAPSVAVLRVETSPPGATIYIDRKDLGSRGRAPRPLAMPPGKYRVLVELEGYEPGDSGAVEAKLGGETRIEIPLKRIVGTVAITVNGAPGASVHIDDEGAPTTCAAPCATEVPPGRHILYFTREGYQAVPTPVNVEAGKETHATAIMTPLVGSLFVSADEREALVEIDGHIAGFTPAVAQNVPVGKRHVRITLRGFVPLEREIEVKPNQESQLLDLKLTPLHQVTAVSRVAENVDDAPSSVSIIDGQELRAFGYPTIAESLRGIRGISLNDDRAYQSATIRGIGQPNDYGNRVLVLSDGANLNDNLLNSSYIGSDGRTDLHDIEQIEVVRGPGSLLYGTGAFSGVINLVTRSRDEPNGVHVGGGTYDDAAAHARAGFHYNYDSNVGVWASASVARSDGVNVPVTLISPPPGQPALTTANHADQFLSQETAGRLWAGPFTVQWFYHNREQHIPVGVYATTFNDSSTEYVDTRYMAEARYEPKISDTVQVMARVHANRYTFHGVYAYDPSPSDVENYYGTWGGVEGRIVITPTSTTRITVGGEGQYDPEASMQGCCTTNSAGALTSTLYLNSSNPYGFGAGYAVVDSSPVPWLHYSAGARIDDYFSAHEGLGAYTGVIVVPRGALIFKPARGSVLKLMGGRAFRAPSVYEQFYTDGGVTELPGTDPARGLTLQPESIWQGEIEFSQRFQEDWVALAAAHSSYIEHIIDTVPDDSAGCMAGAGSTCIRYANNPPVVTAGFDLEVRREWRQGWMVAASYTFDRGQYTEVPPTLIGQANPNLTLVNAPDHLGSVRFVIPMVPDLASFATRISAESDRRIDLVTSDRTTPAVIADLAISGNIRKFGARYVVGVYNVGNWIYAVPVAQSYLSRTMVQNGRTFLADLVLTYP